MLMPSIMQILDQGQLQAKIVRKAESGFQAELGLAEPLLGLGSPGAAISAAGEMSRPPHPDGFREAKSPPKSGMAELLRTLTMFQEPNHARVVDFFE